MRPLHCLILLALWLSGTAAAGDYSAARARLVEAYRSQDFPAMRAAALEALDARPGYPGALFNLALAQVLDGDAPASLSTLHGLADLGIDFGADAQAAFAPLKASPEWNAYALRLQSLRTPLGQAEAVFWLEQSDFVPEGIALADAQTLYLGSIRHGTLLRIGRDKEPVTVSQPSSGGHWSVFGMRLDGHGQLWFASAAVAQMQGIEQDQLGRTGLFRIDPASGEVSHRALLPDGGRQQLLGDVLIADNGTLYSTDSLTGMVYAYTPAEGRFKTLVAEGTFHSPQGLALDQQQRALFLADYTGGLYRLELATGATQRLVGPGNASLYGVDGLYRYQDSLIAIQNGIQPHRIVRCELDEAQTAIVACTILAMNLPQFDEPTLGAVLGDHFYFIANSHWNRFDQDMRLPTGLSGPIVMRIGLGAESEAR